MLSTRLIGLADFYRLAQDLILNNFQETGPSKEDRELDLNWDMIQNLFNAGWLHIAGLLKDDKLVGYAFVLKVPNLLHKSVSTCLIHTVYVAKEYRKGRNGLMLIKYAENLARALDAEELRVAISRFSKTRQDKPLTDLFAVLGYDFQEVIYSKRV